MQLKERQSRSIAKVITWRVLLTISHTINGFIATGSFIVALKIAGLAFFINSFLFWAHERIWNYFQWNRKARDEKVFVEGHPRTTLKMISWRILITLSNFFIPFLLTGSWGQAAIFAGLATIVNMALYYGHERIWNFIKWGKNIVIA